jgi:hypothetical protein
MVATAVLLLVQVPPGTASLRVDVVPAHMLVIPVMVEGNGLTVTIVIAKQPEDKV